jgi:hypothetical protein
VEEVEEVRVAELGPQPLPIELTQRDEEVGERSVLAREQSGEMSGEIACGHSK